MCLTSEIAFRLKEIRAGINAFTLIEKELKETNIPLKEAVIQRAFRVSASGISDGLTGCLLYS
jgi:hypothetical protein